MSIFKRSTLMTSNHRLWRWLALIFVLSFGALGFIGYQIYLSAPPIPQAVVSTAGDTLYTGAQIQRGQQAWLSAGGQQLGRSGATAAYRAPDWSADWLHREALALREAWAQRRTPPADAGLQVSQQAALDASPEATEMRRNTYDAATGNITLSADRAEAVQRGGAALHRPVRHEPALAALREQYAMTDGTLPHAADREALAAFFFWSAWSATTDRPGEPGLSYTSNWPHEPLVGNTPPERRRSGRWPASS
jgi:nitric oxide reductase subunit B